MKLRTKIFLSLLFIAVIPLVISLLVAARVANEELESEVRLRQKRMGMFVEQNLTKLAGDNLNLLQLVAANPEVGGALLAATTPVLEGSGRSPRSYSGPSLAEIAHSLGDYRFDVVELLDRNGTTLQRTVFGNLQLPALPGPRNPVVEASLEGDAYAESGEFDGRMAITAATPVRVGDETVGHLVGVVLFGRGLAERVKSLSGMEVGFFNGNRIFASTDQKFSEISLPELLKVGSLKVALSGKSHLLTYVNAGGAGRGAVFAMDISELDAAKAKMRKILAATALAVVLLASVVSLVLSTGIVRPLREVVGNLREIADGGGDLSRELPVRGRDEIAELSRSFNSFMVRLREIVGRLYAATGELGSANGLINSSSREVMEGAKSQTLAMENTFKSIEGIDTEVVGIVESTGVLVGSVEQSSAATLELGASIEEVAGKMEALFAAAEEISSATSQLSTTSRGVSDNVGVLSRSAEETVSSMLEMDASIKEIEDNAALTSQLASAAAEDARLGKQTVEETLQGIEIVQEKVARAGEAITGLVRQSGAIGNILTVIDEIADQTSLLSLNASIIAAQAGEHGRGFAVVAEEIRELAERTAVSTREISVIIDTLREGTQEAVFAMREGSEQVDQEVDRSRAAGAALEKIRASTLNAMEQVERIVCATREQSHASRRVTDSMNLVAKRLEQIATATAEQSHVTQKLAEGAEVMRDIAAYGKQGTGEQAKGSRQINESMQQIREMISQIDAATRELGKRSGQLLADAGSVNQVAESNAGRAAELDQVAETLARVTRSLEADVCAFKL